MGGDLQNWGLPHPQENDAGDCLIPVQQVGDPGRLPAMQHQLPPSLERLGGWCQQAIELQWQLLSVMMKMSWKTDHRKSWPQQLFA